MLITKLAHQVYQTPNQNPNASLYKADACSRSVEKCIEETNDRVVIKF